MNRVAKLEPTITSLTTSGFPHDSGSSDGLAFFERYGENFDPTTAEGDIQIWMPTKE